MDLKLDNLKYPNVYNFNRNFGIKKTAQQNAGSLTTEEFCINSALPFDIMRPVIINEDTTLTNIEYNANVIIKTANSILTLGTATEGIEIKISSIVDATIQIDQLSYSIHNGEVIQFIYLNNAWYQTNCDKPGVIKITGSTIAPVGFFFCDGTAISRTIYANLFNEISTNYGPGDGTTTFNLPDFRECAPVGIGQSVVHIITNHDVFTLGEFKDDQIQNITGKVSNLPESYGSSGAFYRSGGTENYNVSGGAGYNAAVYMNASRVVRAGDVTRGKRLGVNFVIKY